jgi:hypothetical protein
MGMPLATWWFFPSSSDGRGSDPLEGVEARWRAWTPAPYLPGVLEKWTKDLEAQEGRAAIFVTPLEVEPIRRAKRLGLRALVEIDDEWSAIDAEAHVLWDLAYKGDTSLVQLFYLALRSSCASREGRLVRKIARLVEENVSQWRGIVAEHRQALKEADGVIVSTSALGRAVEKLNRNVYVCPNAIVPEQWPEPTKPDDGIFRIGFAGSYSHINDMPLIRDALEWAAAQPDVELVFIGWHPSTLMMDAELVMAWRAIEAVVRLHNHENDSYAELVKAKENGSLVFERIVRRQDEWDFASVTENTRVVNWLVDYGAYQDALRELDVGLCPIIPTPYAVCRTDCKLLEYALSGALPICSDVEPFAAWHSSPDVPFARGVSDFLKHVQWAVEHRDEVRERAHRLRARVLAERGIDKAIGAWREAVREPA